VIGCAAFAAAPAGAGAVSVSVVTSPAAMTITHATAGTSSLTLAVTPTTPVTPYTMTIVDASSTAPGFMLRVNCSTRAALGGSLANRLGWASTVPGTSGSLSGTAQTVVSASLLATVKIDFTQTLGAAESVASGACYEAPVTITVS